MILNLASTVAADPAGGAALDQVAIATAGATVATAVLLWLITRHRAGHATLLGGAARYASRVGGLPGWAALPAAIGAVSLFTALIGMYWDISLHIDEGRDAGPLANPAHYLILFGLFGVFAGGVIAMALPRDGERPGPAPLRIAGDWYAPIGGVLMAACGGFALIGFPLDDVWHRLFGQDVTLWGPTHLMLIGGAGMTLIAQAVLLAEGMHAQRDRVETPTIVTMIRRASLMGGLLIGLSTFQGEFDFGVPQYRMVFQPFLIALAAGGALVAARIWIGRGGALAAAGFFLLVRGLTALLVGPVLGETTPSLPLFVVEALVVEIAAIWLVRRPLALGAVSGALIGTVGMASEWLWVDAVFRLPWTSDIVPEGIVMALAGGIAGGVAGALLGAGLRGELPAPRVARLATIGAGVLVAAAVVNGLVTEKPPAGAKVSAQVTDAGEGKGDVAVRVSPDTLADDPAWATVTSWQGGGMVVEPLERGDDGTLRTASPVPIRGDWKTTVRIQDGRHVLGAPVYLPNDPAIPAPEVAAKPSFERALITDSELLQREKKDDIPGWLWAAASALVLALYVAFLSSLAWGVGRVARGERRAAAPPPRERPRRAAPDPVPTGV